MAVMAPQQPSDNASVKGLPRRIRATALIHEGHFLAVASASIWSVADSWVGERLATFFSRLAAPD
jgi:hypothetical protein